MASGTEAKVEVAEKGMTVRAMAIGLVMLVFFVFLYTIATMNIIFNQPNAYIVTLYFMFPFMVVVALIQSKVNFRGAELAVIFTMLFWGCYTYQFNAREVATSYLFAGRYGWKGVLEATRPWVKEVVPPLWGNAGFWIVGSLIFTYWMIFYQYIWRRQIQDIERLPFPMSQIPISIMQGTTTKTEGGRNALLSNSNFWAGFLIALVWTIPSIVSTTASLLKIPSPIKTGYGTGWNEPKQTESTVGIGGQAITLDLTPALYTVLPNAHTQLAFGLAHIAIGYFLPTDVAISVTIAWLLFWWIIPPIQVAMGIFPVLSKPGVMPYWGWAYINLNDSRGLMCQYWVVLGVPFALGLMPLILHRRYFAETIRAAIKGTKIGPEGWQDPYRLYWIGFILCLILSIGWGVVFGAAIVPILLTLAFTFFIFAGLMRVGGEAWAHPVSWFNPLVGINLGINDPNYTVVGFTDRNITNLSTAAFSQRLADWNNFGPWAHPGGWGDAIGSARINRELRGRLKEVMICTAIAMIVGTVVSVATSEWYNSLYPFRYGQTSSLGENWSVVEGGGKYWTAEAIAPQWTAWALGVVLWSVVMLLRMRFAWFLINPVGFMLPWTVHYFSINGLGITIAWILKLTALRVGGPKLVDKIQWFFIGSMAGLAMESFYSFLAGGWAGILLNWGLPRCICGP